MTIVEALPPRPLSSTEFANLESSDGIELVIPDQGENVDDEAIHAALIVGEGWAAGVAFVDGAWEVFSRGRFEDDPLQGEMFNPTALPDDHPIREALGVFAEHGE